ncbi:hypothetical protein EXS74_02815 [Candidatus Woesearchaeota archaeon]|nr:hypothetical protein [Candidatus Woesearchaeota archaeon]
MQKITLLFSDTELGQGNVTDDFVEEELLLKAIRENFHYGKTYPIDLILNGDTFDFLKAPYKGKYPRHITEEISIWKLNKIYNAHPSFFKVLEESLNTNPKSRIIFIHGNHDLDIEFKGVQKEIQELITRDKEKQKRILFPGFEFTTGPIYVEHGSQMDMMYKVKPEELMHKKQTKKHPKAFLKTSWIYNLTFDQYITVKEKYPIIERLNPRARTIELLPLRLKKNVVLDPVTYIVKGFSYTQWIYRSDPLRKFPLEEFKTYVKFLLEGEFELKIEENLEKKLKEKHCKVFTVGHTHRAKIFKIGQKIILNTGSWRDEYQLDEKERTYKPRTKTYGFILHDQKDIESIRLVKHKSKQKSILVKDIIRYTRQKKGVLERLKKKISTLKKREILEEAQVKELLFPEKNSRKVFKRKIPPVEYAKVNTPFQRYRIR